MATCDICGNNPGLNVLSGANVCDGCLSEVNRLRNGDIDTIKKWLTNNCAFSEDGKKFMNEQAQLSADKYGYANDSDWDNSLQELSEEEKALDSMLITSGFTFDGYKVVKYSGYISGDDAIQVNRGTAILGCGTENAGENLTDSLVKIRQQALRELKKAAYDLGCNAVIGVDFDYITLEPETASISGRTTYLPYVFCVTANGNAVVIEKCDDTSSVVDTIKGYKELLDCGAITADEYNKLKGRII